jgi:hypothetical protein
MARIRTVKPEFWTDETMAEISRDARLLFLGLLNHVDDEGRCVYNPRLLKAAVFPLDDDITPEMIRRWIVELSTSARCVIYEASGHRFLAIHNFVKHQKIDRATQSRHPAPADGVLVDISAGHGRACDSKGAESSRARRGLDEGSLLDLGSGSRIVDLGSPSPGPEIAAGVSSDDDGFESFWLAYPKRNGQRVGKSSAQRLWAKLKPAERLAATERLAVYERTCNGYPKDAERYIRARLWQDLDDAPSAAAPDPQWEAFLARHPEFTEDVG